MLNLKFLSEVTLAVVGGNEELAKAVSSKDTNMYIYYLNIRL